MKKDRKNCLDARISLEVLCLANKKMIKKKKKDNYNACFSREEGEKSYRLVTQGGAVKVLPQVL